MTNVAICAKGLSKRYRIGARQKTYKTLRDAIIEGVKLPLYRLNIIQNGKTPPELNFIWALNDISFEIQKGEAVGIIGRNGAGKSTLLKLLARITRPTRGRAEVRGRVGSLLEVGTGFHPELTGRENIYLNGAILGMHRKEIDRKFDEIVEFSEIDRLLDTPVKFYSSGMYMRLAFSVAAHLEPEILLVDEVLAVGDLTFQKKCLGKMQDVAGQGRTVLFVSHNIPAITRLCSKAILLDKGQLIAQGTAVDVVTTYMRRGLEGGTVRTWETQTAPGTPEVKLEAVMLTHEDGEPLSIVSVQDRLKLRLSYRVYTPGLRFRCVVRLSTQGVLAFTSVEPTEMDHPVAGLYHSSVTIPEFLLAEGEYLVGISLFASRGVKSRYVFEEDVLAFEVYDPMEGDSARGDYAERMRGVMQPRLSWQIEIPNK
jgi:lipopolysaccharide transport system ATP-binding protein